MNAKALLALVLAAAVASPAWGQESEQAFRINPFARQTPTDLYGGSRSGDVDRLTNPYDVYRSTDPNDVGSSSDSYDFGILSGSRSGAGASAYGSDSSQSPGYEKNPYGYSATRNPYELSPYELNPYELNPYTPNPHSPDPAAPDPYSPFAYAPDPYAPGADHATVDVYGKDPAKSGTTETGFGQRKDTRLKDPLAAAPSAGIYGAAPAPNPDGSNPPGGATPSTPELSGDPSATLGVNPYDAKSLFAPSPSSKTLPSPGLEGDASGMEASSALDRASLFPARTSGGGAKKDPFASPDSTGAKSAPNSALAPTDLRGVYQ
jgi:hypothetical protein